MLKDNHKVKPIEIIGNLKFEQKYDAESYKLKKKNVIGKD
jgi:hypothetical protein